MFIYMCIFSEQYRIDERVFIHFHKKSSILIRQVKTPPLIQREKFKLNYQQLHTAQYKLILNMYYKKRNLKWFQGY